MTRAHDAAFDTYLICTSPRSGSTLLCHLLSDTGVCGDPESYFHEPSVASWRAFLGLPVGDEAQDRAALAEVFCAARVRAANGTPLAGVRLQRHSFDFFLQQLTHLYPGHKSDLDRLRAAFGRVLFIYLRRDNKLDQAISLIKASQTGLWHMAPDGTEIERLSPPEEPQYDAGQIAQQLAALRQAERDWEAWFTQERITPLRLRYEALADDPGRVLAGILTRLGLDPGQAKDVKPALRRLSDQTSRDWAARFEAEQRKARQSPLP